MTVRPPDIDLARLGERRDALPGVARLREAAGGTPVFLVGGAVRDLLLGRDRADLDVVVEGDVAPIAQRLGEQVVTHDRFGTATAGDGELTIDLASARAESYPAPGALPEVRTASLADDLARRDFTVNAMALPLMGDPELIDPHGGCEDLRAGVLRVLHPGSFEDDPTRALRAARYAARLGLDLETETAGLLAKADLGAVSSDRVGAELRRLAAEEDPAAAFTLAADWRLLEVTDDRLRLIRALGGLLARPPWRGIADREEAIVAAAVGRLGQAEELAAASPSRPSEAVAAAHGHSGVDLAVARALGAEWLDDYVGGWRDVRLEIGGRELIEAGVEPGPGLGRGLEAALCAKLDGETAGREEELRVALDAARRDGGAAD